MTILRASAADTWGKCFGYVRIKDNPDALPNEESEAAKTGTAAAWVAECCIAGTANSPLDLVGRVHKNGIEIDPEMARHLTPYVEMLRQRRNPQVEVFRQYDNIAGTSDANSWAEDGNVFYVDDLKYGYGIIEPTTLQLVAYALLAYTSGIRAPYWQLGIYQPRALHALGVYRTRLLTQAQMEDEIAQLYNAAQQCKIDDRLIAGTHCEYCEAAAICGALSHSVYRMMQGVESRLSFSPNAQQLSDELDFLDRAETMLSARKKAVEAEATVRLRKGETIPEWVMMPYSGKRQFKMPPSSIQLLTGIDATVISPATPAEMERRGLSKDVLNSLTKRPPLGTRLERYDAKKIGKMFNDVRTS